MNTEFVKLSDNYPAFSVLMSVYKNDNPNYLDLALKSIEQQIVKPNEIVLVEDGPLNNTLHCVINKHVEMFEGNFKLIKLEKNSGLGEALKIGTNYVSNQWIARMDSDDISVPERFELQLQEIIKNPKLAIVGGQITEFTENNTNIGARRVPLSNREIRQYMKWRSPFNHPSVMIKKSALEKVGGYVPYGNLEDYYLWARIIVNKYPVCNINKSLVRMRVDKGMYARRGKFSNIKYFYRLRTFLKNKGVITLNEEILGDMIMTMNIIMPNKIRKTIYQCILHKSNNF